MAKGNRRDNVYGRIISIGAMADGRLFKGDVSFIYGNGMARIVSSKSIVGLSRLRLLSGEDD